MARRQTLYSLGLALLLWLIAACFFVTTLVGAHENYSPVPFWDMWPGYLTFYTQVTDGVYGAWFAQHTEHRIVLGNLFFWADLEWFGGRAVLLAVMNVVFICSLAGLVAWTILTSPETDRRSEYDYALAGATTSICLSWLQHENINWGFQASFFVSLVVPFAAFLVLQAGATKGSNRLLSAALLLGIGSAGTMANGMAVLPAMALALTLVQRYRWAAGFALAAAIVIALYSVGYRTPELNVPITKSLAERPWDVVRYTFTFLGGAFGHAVGSPPVQRVAELTGAAGLVVLMLIAAMAYRRDGFRGWVSGAMLFLAFVTLSAVATAAGRVSFGLDQAMSSRYATYSLLFWALLLVNGMREASAYGRGRQVVVFAGLMIALGLLPSQRAALQPADAVKLEKLTAALAFELGVRDAKQIEAVFPWLDVGFILAQRPRERNLSIFGDVRFRDRREELGKSAVIPLARCVGEILAVEEVPGDSSYRRVSGWIAQTGSEQRNPSVVGFVSPGGIYVGFGVAGTGDLDLVVAGQRIVGQPFKGYARAVATELPVSVVGMLPDCVVEDLGTPRPRSFKLS